MKIIVSSILPSLQSKVDPRRFGRSAYLLEVDTETLSYEVHLNPGLGAWGKTSLRAAQLVVERRADGVISGGFDLSACVALGVVGVSLYRFTSHGTVQDAIMQLKAGELEQVSAITHPGNHYVGGDHSREPVS
jgi:predicted Fe-Mo cluster-binding NifX family protein